MNLENKNIILTGANGLLGRNFTEAILNNGANVFALDINFTGFQEQFDPKIIEKVKCFNIDITDDGQLLKFLKNLQSNKIVIHGLVNNAAVNPKVENGGGGLVSLENLDYEQWKNEVDLGLWATINLSRYIANWMLLNKTGGVIVNIGSDYGHLAPKQNLYDKSSRKPVTYSAIKYGIVGVTKYFATYYSDHNIRVNCLSPGGIYNNQDSDFLAKINEEIPLGRMANSTEINGALCFLLSEESSYVTGIDLIVDGGRSIW
jgi:NAD(P)-dependent dehydrogenase (short-subunit alcohol dehydrogenase family)